MKRPRFRLLRTDAGVHFVLVAPNGEIVLTSEVYTSLAAARKGISAVRRYALAARTVDET